MASQGNISLHWVCHRERTTAPQNRERGDTRMSFPAEGTVRWARSPKTSGGEGRSGRGRDGVADTPHEKQKGDVGVEKRRRNKRGTEWRVSFVVFEFLTNFENYDATSFLVPMFFLLIILSFLRNYVL